MKARIRWLEEATFVAETGSGHAFVLDGPPEHGGRNLGVRPMEAMLVGIGACTAFDVVSILGKARQAVTDCTVEVDAERAPDPPKVFTRIRIRFVVRGRNLRDAAVRRAVDLSAEKYCSATAMLRPTVEISHDYVIEDEGTG